MAQAQPIASTPGSVAAVWPYGWRPSATANVAGSKCESADPGQRDAHVIFAAVGARHADAEIADGEQQDTAQITGQELCARGTASAHSPASQHGNRIADIARCGQSRSSSHPTIAPRAHSRIAEGQCSCMLKICPAMAMAPPKRYGAHGVERDAQRVESVQRKCAAGVESAHRQHSSAIRWKGDSSSQCALTNSRTPAASMMPPNAKAMITGQRARRSGACSVSNWRIRSACERSRSCASTQRSSDGSSSIRMCLRLLQQNCQMGSGAESVT